MLARRFVLVVAVAAMFLGSAPVASAAATGKSSAPGTERSASKETSRRDRPQLATFTLRHRSVIATSTHHRRIGEGGAKVRALSSGGPSVAASVGVSGVDAEADARLLRASNTPCCVRGPPTAA